MSNTHATALFTANIHVSKHVDMPIHVDLWIATSHVDRGAPTASVTQDAQNHALYVQKSVHGHVSTTTAPLPVVCRVHVSLVMSVAKQPLHAVILVLPYAANRVQSNDVLCVLPAKNGKGWLTPVLGSQWRISTARRGSLITLQSRLGAATHLPSNTWMRYATLRRHTPKIFQLNDGLARALDDPRLLKFRAVQPVITPLTLSVMAV
ncbi:hypothetical protein FRC17_000151 [Serendipita sp. 399]|nr:hypothetical protein FRC17_000151 [Serendipita sp. 399]